MISGVFGQPEIGILGIIIIRTCTAVFIESMAGYVSILTKS